MICGGVDIGFGISGLLQTKRWVVVSSVLLKELGPSRGLRICTWWR